MRTQCHLDLTRSSAVIWRRRYDARGTCGLRVRARAVPSAARGWTDEGAGLTSYACGSQYSVQNGQRTLRRSTHAKFGYGVRADGRQHAGLRAMANVLHAMVHRLPISLRASS
jgi:hypothetical protein